MSAADPIPRVHVVAVVGGGDGRLLPHLVDHYRSAGVDSFFIIRHAESTADPSYEEIGEQARKAGVELYDTWLGPWSDGLHGEMMSRPMRLLPDDWFLPVDLDEFHLYDRPLADLVEQCEREGFTHVCGCFVDRVGPGGTLPDFDDRPLWEQFPLGGALSSRLVKAPTLKVGLIRGRLGVGGGHHGVPGATGLPRTTAYIQVHHFKWTRTVVDRMRRRAERYETGAWSETYHGVADEARQTVAHFDRNQGRVDIDDERLLIGPCGSRFEDTATWKDIEREAQKWQVILSP